MRKLKGFNLLELMLVMTIVAILAAFALPIYTQHVARAKRFEAEVTLTKIAAALENFYAENNSYRNASLEKLGFQETSANDFYQLAIQNAGENYYLLSATPIHTKADPECATLLLNSTGEKTITGTGNAVTCW